MSSDALSDQAPTPQVSGAWDLIIRTPVGRLAVVVVLTHPASGTWTGTAQGVGESVALEEVSVSAEGDGHRITWSQTITRPMRLRLRFDVLATGDTLTGSSRAGRLPRSSVTGTRR